MGGEGWRQKGRAQEAKEETDRKRGPFHMLVHSPNGPQRGARPEQQQEPGPM